MLGEVAPLNMFEEANTKTNLPAQIDMMSQLAPQGLGLRA